jgi:hypothetical protein
MTLFSRRVIQRCIDENARWLRPRQTRRHVEDLNRRMDVLSTIWEVVLLHAFDRFGAVEHEPDRFGSKRPDILFTGDSSKFRAMPARQSQQSYSRSSSWTPTNGRWCFPTRIELRCAVE